MAVIGIIFGIVAFAVAVTGFVATIIILVEAFKTSVTDGLLSLLVPFYIMYFMFAKLQHSKKTLLIVLFMIPAFFLPVFTAMGIYGVRKYIANAKEAEARMAVLQIARGVVGSIQAAGNSAELPESAPAVPSSLSNVSGKKYMSAPSDWSGTWQQIRFSMSTPQYFQYQWERTSPTTGVVRALGDLDGNGDVDVRIEVPIQCGPQSVGVSCQYPPEPTRAAN